MVYRVRIFCEKIAIILLSAYHTSSSCLHLIPSAFIVFPENPSLFPRPGVGRAHEKGLLMPLFVLQKILKFMYNLSRMGNTIIR